ncbi:hypothetical protein Zmor_027872 [Zophobas morio]|uniref:Uncharacterized protein n=2 Tax=Zophobas morio TaxID=2755281 RepID=A0AA38M2V6_9CUCU|nr:hypothetical protein Zmor_027872 [Zophobas morio]
MSALTPESGAGHINTIRIIYCALFIFFTEIWLAHSLYKLITFEVHNDYVAKQDFRVHFLNEFQNEDIRDEIIAMVSVRNKRDTNNTKSHLNISEDNLEESCKEFYHFCPSGPQGLVGISGQKGEPGFPGSVGEKGEPGDEGNTFGFTDSLKGEKGERGDTGYSVPNGHLEVSGPQCQKGEPGIPGIAGVRGVQGPPGVPGRQGLPGPAGSPGYPGSLGRPGIKGLSGPPGLQGPPAASCLQAPL